MRLINWLLSLIHWNRSKPLELPHPEEPINPCQTAAGMVTAAAFLDWAYNWEMPAESHIYLWDHMCIKLYDAWPNTILEDHKNLQPNTPAFSLIFDSKMYLHCLAAWYNPGVIAHEVAHFSWSLLSDAERLDFENLYTPLIKTDPYIKLLYSQNIYGLSSTIEGHAEVYRYIGQKMPAVLKKYYPKLF